MDRALVLYDDRCGFCRWSVRKIASWDRTKRLRFAPIRSVEGEERLAGMDLGRRDESWHLITRDHRVVSAGSAVPELLGELPGGRPLARVAEALPRLTDRTYRVIARRRAVLGRLLRAERCEVPADR